MGVMIERIQTVFAGKVQGAGWIRPPGAAEVAAIGKAA